MATKRFSKETLREHLQTVVTSIQSRFGFDVGDGWHQVGGIAKSAGENVICCAAEYGRFRQALELAEKFGFQLDIVPDGYRLKLIGNGAKRWVKGD